MPVIRFVDIIGAAENITDHGCATYMYTLVSLGTSEFTIWPLLSLFGSIPIIHSLQEAF